MKKDFFAIAFVVFIAIVGLLQRGNYDVALASTDVSVVVSSCIASQVVVTTGTAIRVDNYNRGAFGTSAAYLMPGRILVVIQNQNASNNIYCGPGANVAVSGADVGMILGPLDTASEGLLREASLYCIAATATGALGANAHVMQCARQ